MAKVKAPAMSKLTTGTVKMACTLGKCAMIKQHSGIVTAPTMKAIEAIIAWRLGAGKSLSVTQNNKLTAPSPKKEMWPRRYIRRFKLP